MRITEELLRKRAEHNEMMLSNLEEVITSYKDCTFEIKLWGGSITRKFSWRKILDNRESIAWREYNIVKCSSKI